MSKKKKRKEVKKKANKYADALLQSYTQESITVDFNYGGKRYRGIVPCIGNAEYINTVAPGWGRVGGYARSYAATTDTISVTNHQT